MRTIRVGFFLWFCLSMTSGLCAPVSGEGDRTGPARELHEKPDRPTAAGLASWIEDKDVVEICFAGPHVDPEELRKSVSLQVRWDDRSFRLSFGEGGGEDRAFARATMNVTDENVQRLLALQAELAPRGYVLDEKDSRAWSYASDAKVREKAVQLMPQVLEAFQGRAKEAVPDIVFTARRRKDGLAGIDYNVPDTQIRGFFRADPITPDTRWRFNVLPDVSVLLPHLGMIVEVYYRPGQPGGLEDDSPEHQALRTAFLSAVRPLLKLEETPEIIDGRTHRAMPMPALGDWGEAVEGVSVRLAADKAQWKTDETPIFVIDLKSQKARPLPLGPAGPGQEFEVVLDGTEYRYVGPDIRNVVDRTPVERREGVHLALIGKGWQAVKDGKELELTPGRHAVQAVFVFEIAEKIGVGALLRAPSGPVEIEVLAAEPDKTAAQLNRSIVIDDKGWLRSIDLEDGMLTYVWYTLKPGKQPAMNAANYDRHEFAKRLSDAELARFGAWIDERKVFSLPKRFEKEDGPGYAAQLGDRFVVSRGEERYEKKLDGRGEIPDAFRAARGELETLCREIRDGVRGDIDPALRKKRDEMLAQADATIRKGLLDLGEK